MSIPSSNRGTSIAGGPMALFTVSKTSWLVREILAWLGTGPVQAMTRPSEPKGAGGASPHLRSAKTGLANLSKSNNEPITTIKAIAIIHVLLLEIDNVLRQPSRD